MLLRRLVDDGEPHAVLPAALAARSNLSASSTMRSTESGGVTNVATPMLHVTLPPPALKGGEGAREPVGKGQRLVGTVSGIMTTNSSPPSRATPSTERTELVRTPAKDCKTRSPSVWPLSSFTRLKSSMSRKRE